MPNIDRRYFFGIFIYEYKSVCLLLCMQTFEAFKQVYCFLVRSDLDQSYIKTIDTTIENGTADKNVRRLVQNVRAFHEMRTTLCGSISSHLSCATLLQDLAQARGLEQFDSVPNKSTCFISGETLQKSQGVLLMLNGKHPSPSTTDTKQYCIISGF